MAKSLQALTFRRRLAFEMLFILTLVLSAAAWLYDWERASDRARASAATDAEVQVLALNALLDRYRSLPRLWAEDTQTTNWVRRGNLYALKQKATDWTYLSGAYATGVYNADGESLVWVDRESGRGRIELLPDQISRAVRQGSLGRGSLIDAAGRPLYLFAAPVRGAAYLGAILVVVDLSQLEQQWVIANHPLVVVDQLGDVIVTNVEAIKGQPFAATSRYDRGWVTHQVRLPVMGWTLWSIERIDMGRGWVVPAMGALVGLVLWLTLARVFRRQIQSVQQERLQKSVSLRLERQVSLRTRDLRLEIEERQQAQRKLEAAQAEREQTAKLAAIGQLSTTLSHEYNQPIATVRTYAQNAQKLLAMGKHDTVADNLGFIVEQTERMSMLSKTLLGFARRSDSQLSWVDWQVSAREASILLLPRCRIQQVELQISGPPARLKADSIALTQVLLNLLSNALDAVRDTDDAQIGLTGQWAGDGFQLRCTDNGPGVADAVKDQLFEPFATTKPQGSGLGLGLSLVHDLMQRFDGQVQAVSGPDGSGATFILTFNHAQPASEP